MKRLICTLTLSLSLSLSLFAGNVLAFNMIEAAQVRANFDTQAPMALVDIQEPEAFAKHHLPGAMATHAYPVKSKQDKAKLDAILPRLIGSDSQVVIICPRGKGGAERTYAHLKASGVAEERLFILEGGQEGWPYAELVLTK